MVLSTWLTSLFHRLIVQRICAENFLNDETTVGDEHFVLGLQCYVDMSRPTILYFCLDASGRDVVKQPVWTYINQATSRPMRRLRL